MRVVAVLHESTTSIWMGKRVLKRIPAIRGKADFIDYRDHSMDFDDYENRMSYFGDFMCNSMNATERRVKGIDDKLITYYKRWTID